MGINMDPLEVKALIGRYKEIIRADEVAQSLLSIVLTDMQENGYSQELEQMIWFMVAYLDVIRTRRN